jgi:toxin ParE1/3/4
VKKAHLVFSDSAVADILEQATWYEHQSGIALANRWDKAVTSAILRILDAPQSGSPCSFRAPELVGLRRKTLIGFPKHLLFYTFQGDEVFVLRVLHGARDLDSLL